jgi:hypothetical protein
VQHTQAVTGLTIATELTAPVDILSDSEQTVVLRVAQEALQNVRKHAAASQAVVSTRLEDEDWVLQVSDDGRGFDPGAVAARGRRNFGLQFMRERAELIGARIDVRSQPDRGTVVRLAIPTGPATGGRQMTATDCGPGAVRRTRPAERRRGHEDPRGRRPPVRMGIANILGREPDFSIVAGADDRARRSAGRWRRRPTSS